MWNKSKLICQRSQFFLSFRCLYKPTYLFCNKNYLLCPWLAIDYFISFFVRSHKIIYFSIPFVVALDCGKYISPSRNNVHVCNTRRMNKISATNAWIKITYITLCTSEWNLHVAWDAYATFSRGREMNTRGIEKSVLRPCPTVIKETRGEEWDNMSSSE